MNLVRIQDYVNFVLNPIYDKLLKTKILVNFKNINLRARVTYRLWQKLIENFKEERVKWLR